MIGHVAPEAALGGPIALVHDGDEIVVDVDRKALDLVVPDDVLTGRRAAWSAPAARYTSGVLAKYAALVSSASDGAVTNGQRMRASLQVGARDRPGGLTAAPCPSGSASRPRRSVSPGRPSTRRGLPPARSQSSSRLGSTTT